MIEIDKLTKKFGDFTAVDEISLRIETGEFFGLLGPNGAGKTTISMMSTVRHLSGGMKRKLMICRALLTEPKILLLDEPTPLWQFTLGQIIGGSLRAALRGLHLQEKESLGGGYARKLKTA